MKMLHRAVHSIEAQSLKDLLASAGIDSFIEHQTTSLLGEGAIHLAGMPGVWVEDHLLPQALEVKKDWIAQQSS